MSQNEMKYTDLILNDIYALLTKQENIFPKSYTKMEKLKFVDRLLEYFEETQSFEKCNELNKLKEKIVNGGILSNKTVKSRSKKT